MLSDIYIPEWLYRSWPWLCLAGSIGYACIGQWPVAIIIGIYAVGIWYHRM